jgi:NADPH:quinone reductase
MVRRDQKGKRGKWLLITAMMIEEPTVKAIQLSCFGGPDVLETVEMPKPAAGRGEILVRVESAGVNFFETLLRADRYAVTPQLPMIPGVEAVGIVEAFGEDVMAPGIGTRVAAPLFAAGAASGGYADYITIAADWAIPVPEGVSAETATALMVQGLSALHLIRRSQPKGKSVVVTAAAGGVGSLVVQLAKTAGASRVIALAGSTEKLALARTLGADDGIDYTRPGWSAELRRITETAGADIVYDLIGGAMTPLCLEALADGGELVFAALGRLDLHPEALRDMMVKNQSIRGFALLPLLTQNTIKTDLAYMFELALTGGLNVLPGEAFPLNRAAEAHRALESRQTTGKVVLLP